MKYLLLILLFILIQSIFLYAQTKPDSIIIKHSDYFIAGKEYSKGDISDILASNPASKELVHSSNLGNSYAWISLIGGCYLTLIVISDIKRSYNNYGYFPQGIGIYELIGSAIVVDFLAIYLFKSSNNCFKNAIKEYNKSIKENTSIETEFKVNFTWNRIGFSYTF
ncbi:MAG: hypothetical protein ABSG15_01715 [FCB group bacterium]|jgi:hypothetical protein